MLTDFFLGGGRTKKILPWEFSILFFWQSYYLDFHRDILIFISFKLASEFFISVITLAFPKALECPPDVLFLHSPLIFIFDKNTFSDLRTSVIALKNFCSAYQYLFVPLCVYVSLIVVLYLCGYWFRLSTPAYENIT